MNENFEKQYVDWLKKKKLTPDFPFPGEISKKDIGTKTYLRKSLIDETCSKILSDTKVQVIFEKGNGCSTTFRYISEILQDKAGIIAIPLELNNFSNINELDEIRELFNRCIKNKFPDQSIFMEEKDIKKPLSSLIIDAAQCLNARVIFSIDVDYEMDDDRIIEFLGTIKFIREQIPASDRNLLAEVYFLTGNQSMIIQSNYPRSFNTMFFPKYSIEEYIEILKKHYDKNYSEISQLFRDDFINTITQEFITLKDISNIVKMEIIKMLSQNKDPLPEKSHGKKTNREIRLSELNNQIFANTGEYMGPAIFANRIKSRKMIVDELTKKDSQKIIIISDLLGAGKSYLIEMIRQALNIDHSKPIPIKTFSIDNVIHKSDPVFIDDIDIRTPYEISNSVLGKIGEVIHDIESPLVLIGDYTLMDTHLRSNISKFNIKNIELEILDAEFLKNAISMRLKYYLGTVPYDIIDQEVLETIVPQMEKQIATFRTVLNLLQEFSRYCPDNDEPFFISKREVTLWLNDPQRPKPYLLPNQVKFYSWFIDHIRVNFPGGKNMKQISSETFFDIIPDEIKPANSKVVEEEILIPLSRIGLLSSLGTPHIENKKFIRYPGPYLPSIQTLIKAQFGGDIV